MKFGIVPSSEITSESLHARDYLLDPEYEARKIVLGWNRTQANIIDLKSPAGQALLSRVQQGLERAYELGQRRGPNQEEDP